jgi:Na+/melibiose symporter-like transporter
MLSSDINNIRNSANAILFAVSIALVPVFALWTRRQERIGRPALIPNSLWKNQTFASVCVMVLLSSAVLNAMELFCSLFFQKVQGHTALTTSLYFLPSGIIGATLNLTTGIFVHRVPALYALLFSSIINAGSPLLMALTRPSWPYWYDPFWAQVLVPMSADVLFTIGLLIVSDVFPERTQALAGAVFNTLSQLGGSIGVCSMSVVSAAAIKASHEVDKDSSTALAEGYRASFWALFAIMSVVCLIGGVGLRRLGSGKVGLKRE